MSSVKRRIVTYVFVAFACLPLPRSKILAAIESMLIDIESRETVYIFVRPR